MQRKNKRVNVYMEPGMYTALRQEADYLGTDMSHVARTAIESHLRGTFQERSQEYPGQTRITYSSAMEGQSYE